MEYGDFKVKERMKCIEKTVTKCSTDTIIRLTVLYFEGSLVAVI